MRKNFTRYMALLLAICLIAGVLISVFAVLPILLPFLLVAAVAGFLVWRFVLKKKN